MTALYFHNLSIKAPDSFFDITVTKKYNNPKLKKHNVFYVDDKFYDIGITEAKTPQGNKVRVYDVERCICDIIRSKKRMDIEHVKYAIKEYLKRKDNDLIKLSKYADMFGIKEKVMDFVSMMYEQYASKRQIKKLAVKRNLDFNILLRLYMYDRFIERLAVSKYRDNFILKGVFYLSTLFGLESRSTKDIDTAIKDANFTKENVEKMIKSIIAIDINDGALISFIEIGNIREEDQYGGFRVILNVKVDTIRENFQIDVATGDLITPKPIVYKYRPILGDSYANVWSYNIETVIAEKLETILRRAEANSRIRDYYDLYLIYTKGWNDVKIDDLRKAIDKTFEKRNYTRNIEETIAILKNRWDSYKKKYEYANDINYDEIMKCIEEVVKVIVPVVVQEVLYEQYI